MWGRPPESARVGLSDFPKFDFRSFLILVNNSHQFYGHIFHRVIVFGFIRGRIFYFIHNIYSSDDFAENSMLAVQPRRALSGNDEKLAAIGIWPGVGHSQNSSYYFIGIYLVFESIARSADAVV